MPVYNSERHLKASIESCLNQTYSNLELIIINDGSTDDSEDIIREIRDYRIHYFKVPNNGPCRARNLGIEKAIGQLLQFMDSDDLLDERKIEKQVDRYLICGDEYVYSGIMGKIIEDEKSFEEDFDFYYKNLEVEEYFRKMFNNFGKYYTTGMWLIPRKLIRKTHGWDEKVLINNDGEYISRVILLSKGIKFCPWSVFYYRRDVPLSVSKNFTSKKVYQSWLYSYKCYVKNFETTFNFNTAKELGRRALSVYYCNSYPNYPDLLAECKNDIKKLGYNSPYAHGGRTFQLLSMLLGTERALAIREFKKKSGIAINSIL